ncbi:hypothetical protein GQ44DRAFT_808098 [Phaeosphaeriaceae sp. PMI808]|nr:hypothetical protein GQ44DRAFT_808098 [Phaeosphaeriaceae sp. PMI808]
MSIIEIALGDYIKEERERGVSITLDTQLNPAFAQTAASQFRMSMMAGNDSTSATLVYAYHLLSQHPDMLLKLQQEREEIFRLNPKNAAIYLKKNPALVNQCRYTLAVIKETLRLFPPASTQRTGHSGASIKDL